MLINSKCSKCWYLYMLQCSDDSLYTGITVDINNRLKMHRTGRGSRYVRSRLPVSLAVWWQFNISKSDITKLERLVKSLPRHRKQELVINPGLLPDYCGIRGKDSALIKYSQSHSC